MASPSTLQPALQQIDELDALLKQMLTLPAAPADTDEKPEAKDEQPQNTYRTPVAIPTPVPSGAVLPAVAPPAEPPKLAAKIETAPLLVSPPPLISRPVLPSLSAVAKNETSVFNPPSQPSLARFAPISASTPVPRPSSIWSNVLGGINRRFDQKLEQWGIWGRWLGRRAARNCLGVVGILALAAAAALLLHDWVDWSR
jgi:hypothetical protein